MRYVREHVLRDPARELTAETLLFRERLLNSLNILDLVGYLEWRLGRRLDEDEIVMAHFESVRAMVRAFLQ